MILMREENTAKNILAYIKNKTKNDYNLKDVQIKIYATLKENEYINLEILRLLGLLK